MGKSDEEWMNSALDRRAQVRGSPGDTPPYTLMAPGASKIRHGFNVLQVSIQILHLGVPKWGSHPLRGRSKL